MRHNTQPKNGFFRSLIKTTIAATSTAVLAISIPGNLVMAGNGQTFTDYAKVIHVDPSFRYVTVKVPQRICSPGYNNHSDHRNNHSPHHQRRNRGQHFQSTANHRRDASGAVFIGGIIGGVIGHEVSKNINGRNNVAATLTGAVIGSTLAGAATQSGNHQAQHYVNNGANRNQRRHDKPHKRHQRRHQSNNHQRCTTTTQTRQERRPNGYNVTYVYRGRTFNTHTRHHPGHRIAVQVGLNTH